MNAQRRTALTRLGLREPQARQAHRDYRWRSRFLMLRDAPDSAAEDWMAAAICFVVIVCAAIFAGAVVTIDPLGLALLALAAVGTVALVLLFAEATR